MSMEALHTNGIRDGNVKGTDTLPHNSVSHWEPDLTRELHSARYYVVAHPRRVSGRQPFNKQPAVRHWQNRATVKPPGGGDKCCDSIGPAAGFGHVSRRTPAVS